MKIHYKIIKEFRRFLRGEGGRGGVPKSFSRKIPASLKPILKDSMALRNAGTSKIEFVKEYDRI